MVGDECECDSMCLLDRLGPRAFTPFDDDDGRIYSDNFISMLWKNSCNALF